MDCAVAQLELVPYHFGSIEEPERSALEAHLSGCSACLRDFIALKREIETAPTDSRPSRTARLRLRNAVSSELSSQRPRVVRKVWERPLAFAMAGATMWGALFAVYSIANSPGSAPNAMYRTQER